MTDSAPPSDEYFEHIPWDELMAEVDSRRRATLRWGAGAAVVLVVAGAAWMAREPRPAPARPAVAAAAAPAPVASPAPSSTAVAPAVTPPEPPAARVWAEADLRAVARTDLERRAAAYAEWVLRDLFTFPSPVPAGFAPADVPGPEPGSRSFVEWVAVVSVRELDAGRVRVEALLGRLAAAPGEEYTRIPPQAFELVFDLTSDPPTLVDLPNPVPASPAGGEFAFGEPVAAPPRVREAATEIFGVFGTVGEIEAFRVGDGWRVVGSISDPAGVSWPLAAWLDEEGNEVTPGAAGPAVGTDPPP